MDGQDLGLNDVLRFGLELAALGSLAYWGWAGYSGPHRIVLAAGLPLLAAVLWGTFRVPGDPGPAPVPVPGPARLGLEAVVFTAAVVGLADAGRPWLAAILGAMVLGHYAVARLRVRWLLGRGTR